MGGFNIENRENGFADIENLRPSFNVPKGAFNTFNVYSQPRTAEEREVRGIHAENAK